MSHKFTNELIHETSPYLLQHAHNPVNWMPWSEKALQSAREQNKPILVSIGYAACHWCHVMERESFEDEATAQLMNEHFITIKIDREERPDLDHVYMDAVQAMTGSGGWPLNVFLTPDAKPFYGGTYFPPRAAFNRLSWTDTLNNIIAAFSTRRHEIDAQAENLTDHLLRANSLGNFGDGSDGLFAAEKQGLICQNLLQSADNQWGGFGAAPKFPQTFSIQFLLRHYYKTKNQGALDQALLSLDKMIEGGIYDQIGAGFARYSTDREWLAPHFEKMLYDNALLVSVLSEAYSLTGKDIYKTVITDTISFIKRELSGSQGEFHAALDADSEGEEGSFYVWSKKEVGKLLGEDAFIFCEYYDISDDGNWEGKNILRIKMRPEEFAIQQKIAVDDLHKILERGRKKLLEVRGKRERPLLDDKTILGWNALMNTACSKAFGAIGDNAFKEMAIDNMKFLIKHFKVGDSSQAYHHTWKNGKATHPGFLDDYAFLIQALLRLQEITADTNWLLQAREIADWVIDHFSDEEQSFFYYTGKGQTDIILRKKEIYDGAVPSGNSVMAYNLYQLSILLDHTEWRQRSERMLRGLGQAITKYPGSFGTWACLLQEIAGGTRELVVFGKRYAEGLLQALKIYAPHQLVMAGEIADPSFPFFKDKQANEDVLFYLCSRFECLTPVSQVRDLERLLNGE